MRVENSIKNIFFGLSGQVISAIMGIIVRTVFIYTLGAEYLGVEGLFSSILLMLSLANLGFDTTMIYSLYKPLAKKNVTQIQALMNLYRRAYRLIGIVVLIIGLTLLPFLPFFMNGGTKINNINIIYLLFLLNSVSSYYFVYKQSILIADQRNHIISKIHIVFTILSNSSQIVVLLLVHNFIILLTAQIIFRIAENVHIAGMTNRFYPYLIEKTQVKLVKEEKKLFFENLFAQFLYKISGVVIIGTDNIVISKFVGLIWVGVYSNYLLIISTLTTFISYIFHSITASVGNLNVVETEERKYFFFRVIYFASFWIFGFCSVCLWMLLNPFITLWLGESYVMNRFIVFSIILNFYTTGMQNAATTYRETTGLFKKGKYRPVFAALINIVVSIFLAVKLGIAGVLLGTVISRLCIYFWYDPFVVYKNVFHKNVASYFLRYIWYGTVVAGTGMIMEFICSYFDVTNLIVDLVIKGLVSLVVPNLIFLLLFNRYEEFKYLIGVMMQIISKTPLKYKTRVNNF